MVKTPFNYKFLILKKGVKKDVVAWEYTENRQFMMSVPTQGMISISGLQFNDPQPAWKGAGTAIPVFSLRKGNSFGLTLKRVNRSTA
jgi:4-alpha-glucanotransferase